MAKKCIICQDPAAFAIKATNDYYCKECAENQFEDVTFLISIEDINKPVEDIVDQKGEIQKEDL